MYTLIQMSVKSPLLKKSTSFWAAFLLVYIIDKCKSFRLKKFSW